MRSSELDLLQDMYTELVDIRLLLTEISVLNQKLATRSVANNNKLWKVNVELMKRHLSLLIEAGDDSDGVS